MFGRGMTGFIGRGLALGLGLLAASCDEPKNDAPTYDVYAPARVGLVREVPMERATDPDAFGPMLDLALEAEFWDTIVNSDHAHFPEWRAKVDAYVAAYELAAPRLHLLATAGSVFQMSQAFVGDVPQTVEYGSDLLAVLSGSLEIPQVVPDHVPALVFYENNMAMQGLILGDSAKGQEHLANLLRLPGSEGRAAAPFTYAMIENEAAVRYAIALNEDCETFVCNWTSQIAPTKPIGQLMMLAELHAIVGEYDDMNRLLDRAKSLAEEREWPFLDRIESARLELPQRTYVPGRGAALGLGAVRWPMPIYSNEVNCSNCHVGARAARSGVALPVPYEGHDVLTPTPAPPPGLF